MNILQISAYEALKEKNGEINAKTIIEYIESTSGISEDKAKSLFISEDRLTTIFTTKKELADLKTDLKTEIGSIRTEIANVRTEIKESANTTMKWIIGTIITTISVGVAIIKLF